jgi:hypothetical protein
MRPPWQPSGEVSGIASQRDVEAIEAPGTRVLPPSTYQLVRRGVDLTTEIRAWTIRITGS